MKQILIILIFIPNNLWAQKTTVVEPSIQQQVWSLTEVMYHDVVNPPAAARFYAYSVLAGYEVLSELDPTTSRLQKKLNGYPIFNIVANSKKVNTHLAALYAILETGKNIIPSGYLLEDKQQDLLKAYSSLSQEVIDSSVSFAKKISQIIIQYSKTDGYFHLSTLARYKPMVGDEYWQPTPPEYMSAVEPHWETIRTFFLDSAGQCKPVAFTSFSKDSTSDFYQLSEEVYNTVNHLTEEQKWIANFWDCNPFAVQFEGHMSIGLKKISPGGHWMGITGIVSKQARLNFNNTLLLHTLIALTLHDAFISCWEEKYHSNRIRPETVINRYIDERWKPFLQTPPFPEYPSGHSVISTASAEILTYFLGDHFTFIDTTEQYIGIPARTFDSFRSAAAEARISRLYGGIHFRDAIENGGEEGKQLGNLVIRKIGLQPFLQ